MVVGLSLLPEVGVGEGQLLRGSGISRSVRIISVTFRKPSGGRIPGGGGGGGVDADGGAVVGGGRGGG